MIPTHFMSSFGKPRISYRRYLAYLIWFNNISNTSKQWRDVWFWGGGKKKLSGLTLVTLEKKRN